MSTTFIHISDVMLGARPDAGYAWSGERAAEIYETFEKIIDTANSRNADFLIIAGNLFAEVPSEAELVRIDRLLCRLTDTCVIYAAGQHDCLKYDSPALTFPFSSHTYVIGRPELPAVSAGQAAAARRDARATMALDCLHFDAKGLCIYGVSYFDSRCPRVEDAFVVMHTGEETCVFVGSADDRGRTPVEESSFKGMGFAYSALGGRGRYEASHGGAVSYSGSPEAFAPGGSHGYIWGEISDAGVTAAFVPISKREYKTINYPVNNYTGELDMERDLVRLLELEGRENIFTVRLVRTDGCEKNFDISDIFGAYRLLEISGDRYERSDYMEYERANGSNEFGELVRRMSESGLAEREGIKLAVDQMIELSGLYKRRSKRMSPDVYRETREQVLRLLTAKYDSYMEDEDVKAYELAARDYATSPDVLDELNDTWARERRTELEIRTVKSRIDELPRQRRRERIRTGIRTALVPVMVVGLLSVLVLPSMREVAFASRNGRSVMLAILTLIAVVMLAYYAGYAIVKHFAARSNENPGREQGDELEELSRRRALLEEERSKLHARRVELQQLDGRKREMKEKLYGKESGFEKKRYQIGLLERAIEILGGH